MAQPINVTYRFRSGAESEVPAVEANDLVPLHQLEEMLAGSIRTKESVKVAFHSNAVISSGGFLTSDGYTLVAEDRFLLTAQTDPAENGIYTVDADGNWTRTADADEAAELKAHTSVYILEGDYMGRKYELLADVNIVGTDAQEWGVIPVPASTATNTSLDSSDLYYTSAANVKGALADIGIKTLQNYDSNALLVNRVDGVVGSNLNHMGSFTGNSLPDNASIKTLFQTVEQGMDALFANIGSMKYISPSDITVPNQLWTTVAHNLSSAFPSSVQMYDADDSYAHATHAFRWRPKHDGEGLIVPDAIEIYQDSGVDRHVKVVVQR